MHQVTQGKSDIRNFGRGKFIIIILYYYLKSEDMDKSNEFLLRVESAAATASYEHMQDHGNNTEYERSI